MKFLMSIVMSFNLIVAPVAFAVEGGGAEEEISTTAPESALGVDAASEPFRVDQEDGFNIFWLAQISSISSGVIGNNILVSCPFGAMTPSLWTFFIASIAQISGEFLLTLSQSEAHKLMTNNLKIDEEKLKAGSGGNLQREALTAALGNENKTAFFLLTRAIFLSAISVTYGAAAVTAIVEAQGTPPVLLCNGATGLVQNSLLAMGLSAAWTAAAAANQADNPIGLAVTTGIPSGLFLINLVASSNLTLGFFYDTAIARSITFGASSILAAGVAAELYVKYAIALENIAKIERVIADLDPGDGDGVGVDGAGQASGSGGGGSGDPTKFKGTIKELVKGISNEKNCIEESATTGLSASPGACKNVIKITRPRFKGNLLNPGLQSTVTNADSFAQSLVSGDLGKAIFEANGLANQAGRIRELKKAALNDLNAKLKKEGKKPFDFDKAIKDKVAAQIKGAEQVVKDQKLDINNFKTPTVAATPESKKPVVANASGQATISIPTSEPYFAGSEATEVVTNNSGTLEQNLEKFESNEKDISPQNDVSLFKQLSNRYLLNYRRLFKKLGDPGSK